MPTWHPAALLRDENKKIEFWRDLKLVVEKMQIVRKDYQYKKISYINNLFLYMRKCEKRVILLTLKILNSTIKKSTLIIVSFILRKKKYTERGKYGEQR